MKKLLMLLMLIPLSAVAKFYDGTVYFNDGNTKTGLIEIPEEAGKQTLKFKTDLKAKAESISIDDVKGFDITSGKNETPTRFITILLARGPLYGTKECKVDSKKSWVRIEKEGGITLYSSYLGYRPGVRGGGGVVATSGWPPQTSFYLKRADKDYAVFFFMILESSGTTFAINNFKALKKLTKAHFETHCATLESFVDPEDFKTNGINRIVELYDEHCGTK